MYVRVLLVDVMQTVRIRTKTPPSTQAGHNSARQKRMERITLNNSVMTITCPFDFRSLDFLLTYLRVGYSVGTMLASCDKPQHARGDVREPP